MAVYCDGDGEDDEAIESFTWKSQNHAFTAKQENTIAKNPVEDKTYNSLQTAGGLDTTSRVHEGNWIRTFIQAIKRI